MDLISVIVPYYKKKKYIDDTINSILKQTYKRFEIIIIYDDNNKSDLNYLIKKYKSYKNIKILVNKKNIGAGLSRNFGIRTSSGKYIAFLDADDLWQKNKIAIQLKWMKSKKYNISHTSYNIVNDDNEVTGQRIAREFNSLRSLITSCDIGLSTVMIKKSILNKKDLFPKLKTKEDFVFWINLVKKGHKIKSLNNNLTKWRKAKNSLSSSTLQKLTDGYKLYRQYLGFSSFKSIVYLFLLSINFLKKRIND